MNPFQNLIFLQILSDSIVLIIGVFFIWFLQGNFLFRFIQVKASRDAKKMVRIREVDHDAHTIGKVDSGFLVFKYMKDIRRIPLPENIQVFYRCMGISWVDVSSDKNAFTKAKLIYSEKQIDKETLAKLQNLSFSILKADYETVSGHDAIKTQNFLKRILMMSQLKQDMSMVILVLIGLVILGVIAAVALSLKNGQDIAALGSHMDILLRNITITAQGQTHL